MNKPKIPTAPKTTRILNALLVRRDVKGLTGLTVAVALRQHGVYALSQECGRLRKLGWDIKGRMIKTSNGVHCKEYYL